MLKSEIRAQFIAVKNPFLKAPILAIGSIMRLVWLKTFEVTFLVYDLFQHEEVVEPLDSATVNSPICPRPWNYLNSCRS